MSGAEQIDFEQRLAAFDYDAKSYSTFPMVKRAIERHAPAALAALYRHIANTSQIRGMFSSQARMDHARDKQMEHWRKLFSRPLDHDYAASSTHIGQVHARIGLAPTWYISGYARMLEYVPAQADPGLAVLAVRGTAAGPGRDGAGQGVADRHGHRAGRLFRRRTGRTPRGDRTLRRGVRAHGEGDLTAVAGRTARRISGAGRQFRGHARADVRHPGRRH